MFPRCVIYRLDAAESNHYPIFLDTISQQCSYRQRHFRFENAWIYEVDCEMIVQTSWGTTQEMSHTTKNSCVGEP